MRLLIVAGEASGDAHGARLARCLRDLRPDVELVGLGGEQMAEAGVDLIYPLADLAVVGFTEVIKSVQAHRRVGQQTLDAVAANPVDAAILIDYPGFNLRLAAALKKQGVRVIYYISPQVWAWGQWRLPKMRRILDLMLVILPFEADFFKQHDIPAVFVGHPLTGEVGSERSRVTALVEAGLDPDRLVLGLLPGSRGVEVEYMLADMVAAAERVRAEMPEVQVILLKADTLKDEKVRPYIEGRDIRMVPGDDYGVRKHVEVAITASGTATLVNAILEVPTVICYRTSTVSYHIARRLAQVDMIGLVNIVAGERICPEFIQGEMTPERIASEALDLLRDADRREAMRAKMAAVRERLGEPGASMRAARAVVEFVQHGRAESALTKEMQKK